jgi:Pyruvate/2-oxoacid:ferredoxin oxidoreductase delta subunit
VVVAGGPGATPPDADLDRLCADVERLRRELPDRWTLVALGPPHGDRALDARARDAAARRLEAAGALVVDGAFPSAGGGPMDHVAAAALLAGGARTVQCSAIVMKRGLGVVNELRAGLSSYLAERGLRVVAELSDRDVMPPGASSLGSTRCTVDAALCTGCGNCTRCPSGAVTLDARGFAQVDLARCTGCGLCVEQCLTGAVALRAPEACPASPGR